MASNSALTSSRILSLLAVFLVLSCFGFSCMTLSRVEKYRMSFEITQRDFAERVEFAVHTFLSNYVERVSTNQVNEAPLTITVSQKFLDDFYTYYRYRHGSWVAVVSGTNFVSGDYFDTGLVLQVSESRMYVQSEHGIVVYRPRKADADAPRQGRAARPPWPETDAPL